MASMLMAVVVLVLMVESFEVSLFFLEVREVQMFVIGNMDRVFK